MKNIDEKPVCIVDEENNNGPLVLKRFDTIAEAENWIAEQEKIDPDKVHRGGFGIDAPEEMLNN
jgi:hypothetical protein